ncbi:MAG: flagellar FliJ family protein [Myxococcota bacterium]|nr:flagellar FliJ family protein [Myxococcota bacterium]
MKRSLATLQRLRKIREDRAASKLRAAKAELERQQQTLESLRDAQDLAARAKLATAANAQEISRHILQLEAKARRQSESVERAERACSARRSILQLRSRELSSLEKVQEAMAEAEAEETRRKEAKELSELAIQTWLKEAA